MKRIAIALGAMLLLLGACAEPAPPPPPARPGPPPAPPRTTSRDECGAAENQRLVGQPRSKIPVPVIPALQRVACTTCPLTLDFVPRRLNFLFDADTGLIREVKCG